MRISTAITYDVDGRSHRDRNAVTGSEPVLVTRLPARTNPLNARLVDGTSGRNPRPGRDRRES